MVNGLKPTPKAGDQMVEEITDPNGNIVYRAIYELVEDPDAVKAIRGATDEAALRAVKKQEIWLDNEFEEIQDEEMGEPSVTRGKATDAVKAATEVAKVGLEIAKFGWEFIKANKPVMDFEVASTSILSKKNTDSLAYYGTKRGSSGIYRWRIYNWPFEAWTAFDIQLELAGTYYGRPPADVPDGYYLPSVYFNVPVCTVYWPYSASASAVVTNPANIGTQKRVNTMCEVLAKVNVSSVIENFNMTFKFKAVGTEGFYRQ